MSVFHTPVLAGASGNQGSQQIEQSLRFNPSDSAFLNRTPGSTGDRTRWTWSAWIKRSQIGSTMGLFGSYTTSNNSNYTEILFASGNTLLVQGNSIAWLNTSQVFRDTSAWYHIVIAFDTRISTADDRIRIYVNGEEINDFGTRNNPGLGVGLGINQAGLHRLGRRPNGTDYFSGYMAEVNFIDGTALAPTDFGEADDSGVWRPIKYAGSYTGNSFYLKFASGDGTDSSGLSNTWTANNFTTSGTGTDVMSDTPTTNWCTLNATDKGSNVTLSEGNLDATTSSTWGTVRGTIGAASGKWYYEFTVDGAGYTMVGVQSLDDSLPSTYLGLSSDGSYGYFGLNGTIYANGATLSPSYSTFTTDDIIGVAWDADAGKIWFAKNGTWQGSGDPAAGTNALVTGIPNDVYTAGVSVQSSGGTPGGTANFGQRDFEYTPPTGFNALNTANLPEPDIADASEHFNTVLYAGNNGTNAITGVGFQPDLVWIKNRTSGNNHMWFDAIRGTDNALIGNTTAAEGASVDGTLSAFGSDGFTAYWDGNAGTGGNTNQSSNNYVAWNWLAGNGTSSNTNGTITSTVSVNATAGFSIITYTGNGTYGATVGHGLGVAPSMALIKNRDGGEWIVYNKVIGATKNLVLQDINKAGTYSGWFNDTEPTSTVLSLGGEADVNRSNDDIVAYCFAEVDGFSKFGSYTGNGSASDGPFVYCGLRPAMVIIKNISTNSNWIIRDSARATYNPISPSIYPNLDSAEINNFPMDFLSNGFKIRDDNGVFNTSGDDYVFMAWAENPFGGSGVSPATAR